MRASTVVMDLERVDVRRGQCLTVWLDRGEGDARDALQVELRVLADGTAEVFIDQTEIVQTFEHWRQRA